MGVPTRPSAGGHRRGLALPRRRGSVPSAAPGGGRPVIQVLLSSRRTPSPCSSIQACLMVGFRRAGRGGVAASRAAEGGNARASAPPPDPVCWPLSRLVAVLAAVQLAAPFNEVPGVERSVVLAAVGLAFTVWAELALITSSSRAPGLLLVVQLCWLLAVLGPAVQPESLRPQVLGNVLVPGLLPVKVACGFLYFLCLPALLRLWPLAPPADRRTRLRFDAARALIWFPYCGLFTTLFVPPRGRRGRGSPASSGSPSWSRRCAWSPRHALRGAARRGPGACTRGWCRRTRCW